MKITARFSGIVSYADGDHEQFAGHLDERGNISSNCTLESQRAVGQTNDQAQWLGNMLAQLSGTITLNPPTPPAGKEVTSMTSQISGHVAYDNNTHGGFVAEYSPKVGAFVPEGGDLDNWTQALANSQALQNLNALFAAVAGTGSSITP
jgi:hypothetical protein